MSYQIRELKKLGKDTFDIELELKLAKEKLAQGKFKLVDIYLESLNPKMTSTWKSLHRSPTKRSKRYLSTEYIKKNVLGAKQKRKELIKKQTEAEEFVKRVKKTEDLTEKEIKRRLKKTGLSEVDIRKVLEKVPVKKKIEKKRETKKLQEKNLQGRDKQPNITVKYSQSRDRKVR